MAIMNCKGDSASPWKIPLWIFASAKLFPPAVNSTLQFFMVFSMKFMTSCDILYILRHCCGANKRVDSADNFRGLMRASDNQRL